jgi:hypothetical protein
LKKAGYRLGIDFYRHDRIFASGYAVIPVTLWKNWMIGLHQQANKGCQAKVLTVIYAFKETNAEKVQTLPRKKYTN